MKNSVIYGWRWFVYAKRWLGARIQESERATLNYIPARRKIPRALNGVFYPVVKQGGIAPWDRFVIPVVLLACAFAVLELYVAQGAGEIIERGFLIATAVFFSIFVPEFLIRLYLKGWYYFRSWGWIDLIVILADGFTLAIFAAEYFDILSVTNHWLIESGTLLRLARLARLFRLGKLFQVFRNTYWPNVIAARLPYFLALIKSFFFAGLAVVIAVLVAVVAFDYDLVKAYGQIRDLIGEGLDIDADDQSATDQETTQSLALRILFQGAALIVVLAVTTLITQFFVPEMRRIREQQETKDPFNDLRGHVLVVVNDPDMLGILEEIVYVFTNYARKDLVVLLPEGSGLRRDDYPPQNLLFLEGEIEGVGLWKKARAELADVVVILGKGRLEPEDYSVLLTRPAHDRVSRLALVFITEQDREEHPYERYDVDDGLRCSLVFVSLNALVRAIEKTAWDRTTLQYALIQRLTEHFDDTVTFPDIALASGGGDANTLLGEIRTGLDDKTAAQLKHQITAGNLLLHFDEGVDEEQEIKLISVINRILRSSDLANEVNLFVYVQSLRLIEWNRIYSETGHPNISVFGVELAAMIAVFHEIGAPGSMYGWLSGKDAGTGISIRQVPWPGTPRRRYRLRREITATLARHQIDGTVIGLTPLDNGSDASGLLRVFKSDTEDGRRVGKDDRILVATAAPPA